MGEVPAHASDGGLSFASPMQIWGSTPPPFSGCMSARWHARSGVPHPGLAGSCGGHGDPSHCARRSEDDAGGESLRRGVAVGSLREAEAGAHRLTETTTIERGWDTRAQGQVGFNSERSVDVLGLSMNSSGLLLCIQVLPWHRDGRAQANEMTALCVSGMTPVFEFVKKDQEGCRSRRVQIKKGADQSVHVCVHVYLCASRELVTRDGRA